MSGYVRRFTELPPIEQLLSIEGLVIVDGAPPEAAVGAGTGAVLLVGEFEDGYFATDIQSKGAVEIFGAADMAQKFGGFGFTYGSSKYANPCARKHVQELWNGNGFLKAFKLRAQRVFVSRVDTSVGSVVFELLASLDGGVGPFVIPNSTAFSVTTNSGTGAATAITGVVATVTGGTASVGTIASGDSVGITIDGGVMVTVVFSGGDTTVAAVIARINAALGYAAASGSTTINLVGILPGTLGSVKLTETTAGVLAKLGMTAGTTAGTGNVGNRNAVTVAELAAIINASTAVTTVNGAAAVSPDGKLRLLNSLSGASATISPGANCALLGFTEGQVVSVASQAGGEIKAGTRVSNGTLDWVTTQTLDIPAGATAPVVAKVRPALDDGTQAGATAATVTTLRDPPSFVHCKVTNPSALTVALTEPQMDAAYTAALNATLNESGAAREANYLLIARRSDAVVREGKSNALKATENGMFGRKYVTGSALGKTLNESIAEVATFRSDRVFYTAKGLKITIPQIAELGTAGGTGFSADGIITVRPDAPLVSICASLAPEENPGQKTELIDDFFEVDTFGEVLVRESYEAMKRSGICGPRVDRVSGTIFQSGVTSSLDSGRKTLARRKMADFIQDSSIAILLPYVKKLNKVSRRDTLRGVWDQFLNDLRSPEKPSASRIEWFKTDDSAAAGNTDSNLSKGLYFILTKVRTYSSMDVIVLQTEIGENTVVTREI